MILNILHRGLKSLIGHKIKTVILLLLIILLASTTAGVVLMTNGIQSTVTHLRLSRLAFVAVAGDDVALEEAGYSRTQRSQGYAAHHFGGLTREMVHEIGDLRYVRAFGYLYTSFAFTYSLDLRDYIPESINNRWGGMNYGMDRAFLQLSAASRANFSQIDEGLWELVAGRLFTEEEMDSGLLSEDTPILIPESFAQFNNLSIGSTFISYAELFELPDGFSITELTDIWDYGYDIWTSLPLSFEVVGIISIPYEPSNDFDTFSIQTVNQNRLFIPPWKVTELNNMVLESELELMAVSGFLLSDEEIEQFARSFNAIEPTWVLYDLADFEAFADQANLILPEFSIVEDMTFLHQDVLNSMANVHSLMNQALIFITGATIIVLTLIILLYLRDRKHEIGVYLALGEKRGKIILQILFEVLSITTIGIAAAVFIGSIISNQMSDFLLREAFINETASEINCEMVFDPELCWNPISNLEFNGFGSRQMAMNIEELIEIFDLSLTAQIVSIFFGIGLATAIISTIVPVIYVLELNPKEILMRGNVG